jgi:uncharacterized small protein (DUF1192 family)
MTEQSATLKLPVWKCKHCGCLWRDNLDDTVSLLNAHQKSCAVCEHTRTREACTIHWLQVADLQSQIETLQKENERLKADIRALSM